MTTTSALQRQVGGGHYRNKAIQPVEFALVNRLDACAFSILKYVTRHAEKNGRQDVEKAMHFYELRRDISFDRDRWKRDLPITFATYCGANQLGRRETEVLLALGDWVAGQGMAYRVREALEALLTTYDVETTE